MTIIESTATFEVYRYDPSAKAAWDAFVRTSKNGTFLLHRDYMDYHCDRFHDHSIIVRKKAEIVAVLPADQNNNEIYSHRGLTYGGLIMSSAMTTPDMVDIMTCVLKYYEDQGFARLYYKTIPTIYHHLPAEEDRYALFLTGGSLYRRDVLSVVDMHCRPLPQTRRRRGATKAEKQGVAVSRSHDWIGYWALLTDHLLNRFGVPPVHSLEEIEKLASSFPENIKLYIATVDQEILAGTVIYESSTVAHVQYIASSERGRDTGALDRLFLYLLDETFREKRYFDFGISNEQQGRVLNRGLIEQKEGFGGRAVVHDFYQIDL